MIWLRLRDRSWIGITGDIFVLDNEYYGLVITDAVSGQLICWLLIWSVRFFIWASYDLTDSICISLRSFEVSSSSWHFCLLLSCAILSLYVSNCWLYLSWLSQYLIQRLFRLLSALSRFVSELLRNRLFLDRLLRLALRSVFDVLFLILAYIFDRHYSLFKLVFFSLGFVVLGFFFLTSASLASCYSFVNFASSSSFC